MCRLVPCLDAHHWLITASARFLLVGYCRSLLSLVDFCVLEANYWLKIAVYFSFGIAMGAQRNRRDLRFSKNENYLNRFHVRFGQGLTTPRPPQLCGHKDLRFKWS